jgi:hypothetical protein
VVAGGTGPDPGRRPVPTRANGSTVWPFGPRADSGANDESEQARFRNLPPSEALGRIMDAFHDYDHCSE